jgi:predicted TIM-barrel fold metal-dependent hydrolase
MAYTEWLLENVVSQSPRLKVLAYLPFSSPEHSLRAVRKFGEHPAVTGFMVTTPRFVGAHRNEYAPVYAELQERDLTLAFHAAHNWGEQGMMQLDKFISVHSLGFPFTTMVHCTNLLMHGILERFPNLKVLWIEAGLAWIPFLMQRLDGEYLKRTSDAPLLKKLPSEYMRDMYFATQPLEAAVRPESRSTLEATFEIIDAENTLVYSSDYPHWDWDLPSAIYDLPFLSEEAKRKILGGNACKILNIQPSDPLPTAELRPSTTDFRGSPADIR